MGKNILIFSDGTGQAGGLRPDQNLSNVYKLYRAARTGPESPIDPAEQIAFYDPGLGTERDEGRIHIRLLQALRKFASAAIGFGISRNITNCYEAILKLYEPGDRIYLCGFSRGAYTVRCVAGVLNLCGIPTKAADGTCLPRFGRRLRAIAHEAVSKVYEHGAGRDRATFEPEREEQGRRFRAKYGSDIGGQANVAPYFIGVFDTVAALGASGLKKVAMITGLLILFLGTAALAAKATTYLGASFLPTFIIYVAAGAIWTAALALRGSLKVIRDFPAPGDFRWHLSGWRSGFYDRYLDKRVQYARHALAIDETRADFARVPWGVKGEIVKRGPGEPEWLEQIWFAGSHSDVGGSYPEDESRLSDTSLEWMVEQVRSLPDPVRIDPTMLHLFPSPAGVMHSEVEALRDKYPGWVPAKLRFTWKEKPRVEALGAPWHPSVLARFALPGCLYCGVRGAYRPATLRNDDRVKQYYVDAVGARSAVDVLT